ncbi:MAG: HAMP domain-containing sensor histidine kinase [Cyanobacteria bacterium P01_A01_bin.83]
MNTKVQNRLLQNLSDVLNREQILSSVSDYSKGTLNPSDLLCSSDLQGATCVSKQPSAIPQENETTHSQKHRQAEQNAQKEWRSAITAVETLLLAEVEQYQNTVSPTNSSAKLGLVFSAPVPLLSSPVLRSNFQSAVFTADAFNVNALMPCRGTANEQSQVESDSSLIKLPLIPQDPISQEQFCLILTANFGLVLLVGQDTQGNAKFHFSFDPATLGQVWVTLRSRLLIANYYHLERLDNLIEQFAPPNPDYLLVTKFSRLLLQNLPGQDTAVSPRKVATIAPSGNSEQLQPAFANQGATSQVEMELLQALTHEVRTPLTTIRTLTKLLLKRQQDFKPNVVKRLQTIDRECTEQIERMELIFRAAELESTPPSAKAVELVPFSLERVFHQSIPRWQEKAKRRNVDLKFTLPSNLPMVVSDPGMLDTVLTGVMESCTRNLPTGGHVDVIVSTAGNQLKLQVLSQASNVDNPFKSLGQLLTFQPATGCLGLNLDATKNIFQALGGKLTVRQRQEQGKELTIFLPLGNSYNTSNA